MGIKIPAKDLQLAARLFAPVIVLPNLHGAVELWSDGVFQLMHDPAVERLPLRLILSQQRLVENRDLTLALRVMPYPHFSNPESSSVASKEGFFTPVDFDRFARSTVFLSLSRHLIALGLFLLLAGFLWSIASVSHTRDYGIAAQFALLIALISLVSMDLSLRLFSVANFETMFFISLLLEAVYVVRLTRAILRAPSESSVLPVAVFVGLFCVLFFAKPWPWIEKSGAHLMTSYVLPMVYLICFGIIAVRARQLHAKSHPASSARKKFLALAATSFALTAFAYIFESAYNSGFEVSWSRWLNFVVLFALARYFGIASRTTASLIESAPASRFHILPEPPERVEGWIVHLEILKFVSDRQIVNTVLSHLWSITQLHGGDIIRAEGRSLIVIFEDRKTTEDAMSAAPFARAMADMAKCLRDLESRLQIVLPEGSFATSILFRAAAIRGAVKPVRQIGETGQPPLAVWQELDGLNSLAAAKQLLDTDLDAALRSTDASIVVMKRPEAEVLSDQLNLPARARVEEMTPEDVVVFAAARLQPRVKSSATTPAPAQQMP